jgi:hypothetical protein
MQCFQIVHICETNLIKMLQTIQICQCCRIQHENKLVSSKLWTISLLMTLFFFNECQIPYSGGVLSAFAQFNGPNTSKLMMGLIYLLVSVNCLCTFQVYAMIVFDSFEMRYTTKKKQPCPRWVRTGIRILFGGYAFFMAVALPFLGSLGPLVGGIALPLTLAYPCFMWIAMKKPRPNGLVWSLNWGLGCFAMVLSFLLVIAAAWTLATKGLDANFFKPK